MDVRPEIEEVTETGLGGKADTGRPGGKRKMYQCVSVGYYKMRAAAYFETRGSPSILPGTDRDCRKQNEKKNGNIPFSHEVSFSVFAFSFFFSGY